jgi:hypothetical protein
MNRNLFPPNDIRNASGEMNIPEMNYRIKSSKEISGKKGNCG